MTTEEGPSPEDCRKAFDAVEVSDVEKSVENVVDNLSNWLR